MGLVCILVVVEKGLGLALQASSPLPMPCTVHLGSALSIKDSQIGRMADLEIQKHVKGQQGLISIVRILIPCFATFIQLRTKSF